MGIFLTTEKEGIMNSQEREKEEYIIINSRISKFKQPQAKKMLHGMENGEKFKTHQYDKHAKNRVIKRQRTKK